MTNAVAEPPRAPEREPRGEALPGLPVRDRIFDVAPEEDLLYSISADGKRKFMHPIVHKGRFWKIRRAIAYGLFTLFVALPVVPVGGFPAVFLDLDARRFHVFGGTQYGLAIGRQHLGFLTFGQVDLRIDAAKVEQAPAQMVHITEHLLFL